MESINYKEDKDLTITSDMEIFDISFYKDKYYFVNLENYVNFIKSCERLIRSSKEYITFIAQLKEVGLTNCQILGNISDGDNVEIEMHHGPILTLFDYCAIVIDYHLRKDEKVNTFMIADEVIDEHYANRVQTIMLSVTPHQLIDTGEIFINFNQARGNLNSFLKKYKTGLSDEHIRKINRYIELSNKYDSMDNGLLDLKNTITNWNYTKRKE